MAPTIGDPFPNLRGETQETTSFNLHTYLSTPTPSWAIIFMHPADFTPVCTTELGTAQSLLSEFTLRNTKLVGFSCDDAATHRAWIDDIETATGHRIAFPMFCDPTRTHAIELGVLDPHLKDDEGIPTTVRAVYILEPGGRVALTMTYPASVGRNFDEILRTLDALQRNKEFGVVTPANWMPGDKTIVGLDLDDAKAKKVFGKDGYTTIKLPSESGQRKSTHYLRYTDDPVLKQKSKKFKQIASRIGKKVSWKPPVSFTKPPGRRHSDGGEAAQSSYDYYSYYGSSSRGDEEADGGNGGRGGGSRGVSPGSHGGNSRGVSPGSRPSSRDRDGSDEKHNRSWNFLTRNLAGLRAETQMHTHQNHHAHHDEEHHSHHSQAQQRKSHSRSLSNGQSLLIDFKRTDSDKRGDYNIQVLSEQNKDKRVHRGDRGEAEMSAHSRKSQSNEEVHEEPLDDSIIW